MPGTGAAARYSGTKTAQNAVVATVRAGRRSTLAVLYSVVVTGPSWSASPSWIGPSWIGPSWIGPSSPDPPHGTSRQRRQCAPGFGRKTVIGVEPPVSEHLS